MIAGKDFRTLAETFITDKAALPTEAIRFQFCRRHPIRPLFQDP
jgi:hypothetical protein